MPAADATVQERLLLLLLTTSASLLCSAGSAVQVDSYSYAVLCWEMLTGQVPWQELQTPMQIIFQVGVMHQVGRERKPRCTSTLNKLPCPMFLLTHSCGVPLPASLQRLPFPDSCPAFLRQLIEDCWADEPSERPGFSLILQRLDEELARVAVDVALRERRTVCRSTVSETDASSAAGGLSRAEASLAGNSGGREMAGLGALASPFDGHALAFTSSSDSSS
jgi:serine/threonine protein kinase